MSKGCPIPMGDGICGEPNSLEIISQFNRLFQDRLAQIEAQADGGCLMEKIKLQEEWIHDLTEQNSMLVRVVQQLESEAVDRVHQLEEKLQRSGQCLHEVMKKYREHNFAADLLWEPLQKIARFEDDIRNVIEFVRRIREEQQWNLEGLFFHHIQTTDLMGTSSNLYKLSRDEDLEGLEELTVKDGVIRELTDKVSYYESFGDPQELTRELHCRRQECETLQQEMADARQALAEEVAAKHDHVMLLKNELQSMEEKCLQADKQTAFKEDIIRELRKELKQLKQQFTQEEVSKLNCTIEELRNNLEKTRFLHDREEEERKKEVSLLNDTIASLQDQLRTTDQKVQKSLKICRKRSKVGFLENSEVQADLLEVQETDLMRALKEETIKMKADTRRKNGEIDTLRNKVNELEGALKTCEERAVNLQDAVTTYYNSVTILEKSEEAAQSQIQQQKITISNLQQALVEAKQEVDEIRKKSRDNDIKRQSLVSLLERSLADMEEENDLTTKQKEAIHREYQTLQDLNFALEIEHCDHLHDMDSLESQLKKYQYLFNVNEDQMKKLSKQKRCYEEIIAYFKQEMGLMADQLNNLQELLTLSNESAQQESSRLMTAFAEVQSLNERLSSQLCACEQKVQLENQMCQLHETKISELQRLIGEKDRDLTKQDTTIADIRTTLHDSQKQNDNLQKTVTDLNSTVAELQCSLQQYRHKSCEEFKVQIDDYCHKLEEVRNNLEEKTAECLKLEMAYNKERRSLKSIQKQLNETESRQQEKQQQLITALDEMRQRLGVTEETNTKLCQECDNLQKQLANLSRKEAVKDLEIKRYRKIVGDLKTTMMELNSELNKSLAQKETNCNNPNCHTDKDMQDVCLGCPCEVEFYQKMVDILKHSVSELKRQLTDTEVKNKHLEDHLKQTKDELNRQLVKSEQNDRKINEFEREIHRLGQELQVKSLQLNDVKKSANEINGSKCVQLAYAQEEIANLKNEVAQILHRQFGLKRENDALKTETAQLQCTISCLHEQNQTVKEQYLARIKNLNAEKEVLLKKNNELLNELRSIQPDKQQHQREIPMGGRKPARQCTSPYSMGSQGCASIYDVESPPPSPDFGLNNEWYSTTFRGESENESENDYCIDTLENLTQQMRQTNRTWLEGKGSTKTCRTAKERKS